MRGGKNKMDRKSEGKFDEKVNDKKNEKKCRWKKEKVTKGEIWTLIGKKKY